MNYRAILKSVNERQLRALWASLFGGTCYAAETSRVHRTATDLIDDISHFLASERQIISAAAQF